MTKRKNKILITLFLCLLVFVSSIAFSFNTAKAQVEESSNVIEDLKKDKNFNILNYPENINDFSMEVIHLAEGESGSVYLYVYQPSSTRRMLVASSISMCTKDYLKYYTADVPLDNNVPLFIVYNLELVDCEGTLFKYKLEGYDYTKDNNFFTNGVFDTTLIRNYEISTIYRPFINGVDVPLDSSAVETIKGLEVGKMFSIKTLEDGSNSISTEAVDVISVTDKYVGSIRYDKGYYIIFEEDVDAWFVSFSTNKVMEKLLDVDIYYNCTDIRKHRPHRFFDIVKLYDIITGYYVKDVSEHAVLQTITRDDEGSHGGGWFFDEYGFKRIITANEFLSGDGKDLPSDVKSEIITHDWVLRFAETTYSESNLDDSYSKSLISNVALLRFKFETAGVIYNLGVVDDMTTPDDVPDVKIDGTCAGISWSNIWRLIALVVLLILLAPVLPYVFSFIITLISLPFKILAIIFEKIKKDGDSSGKKT